MTKEKSKELEITKTYDLSKPPEAVEMAGKLKNIILHQGLYTVIKGKNYAHVDAWQLAGFLLKMNARVNEPKDLSNEKEIKWLCSAGIYSGDTLIETGYAICSSKEVNKKGFDEYAILSMAQTRAIGKAYRNKIGWIMKLAGYQATPSEEMHKVNEVPQEASKPSETSNSSEKQGNKKPFTPPLMCSKCDEKEVSPAEALYSQKLYGKRLCRDCQSKQKAK